MPEEQVSFRNKHSLKAESKGAYFQNSLTPKALLASVKKQLFLF
jgi:hypothetical protein